MKKIGTSKTQTLICAECKQPISGAKTVIGGRWHCGDCTYLHDYPSAVLRNPTRRRGVRKQTETLFELPPRRHRDA